MDFSLIKLKPAVSKNWLLAAAGLMWSAVGVLLCGIACRWLVPVSLYWEVLDAVSGLTIALVIYYFGFSKIAKKNIHRLSLYPDRACFFAFQAWRSYIIIMIMMLMGIMLRHSPIQKYYLAIIYLAIGGALLLSSFHYYVSLWREVMDKNRMDG